MTGKLKLAWFAELLCGICSAQSLTLSAPATVPSGHPFTLTVTYIGGTFDDVTFNLPLPPGSTMTWQGIAQLCSDNVAGDPLIVCDGPVFTATITLPDGAWVLTATDALGTAADGSSGPVQSNSITVTVGIPAPSSLSATVI